MCGLGGGVRRGRCMRSEQDRQCVTDGVCVLEHCLLDELVSWRSAAQCADANSKSVLSGYSSGPRGTEGTRAECVSTLNRSDVGARLRRADRSLVHAAFYPTMTWEGIW